MTGTDRNWRDLKMPRWARDAAEAEIAALQLKAALAWPTEAKPEPLPFRWGDYDKLIGEPVPGQYWSVNGTYVETFWLARKEDLIDKATLGRSSWGPWVFKTDDGGHWHTSVQRGPLFDDERKAKLYRRWLMCEDFASQLLKETHMTPQRLATAAALLAEKENHR